MPHNERAYLATEQHEQRDSDGFGSVRAENVVVADRGCRVERPVDAAKVKNSMGGPDVLEVPDVGVLISQDPVYFVAEYLV